MAQLRKRRARKRASKATRAVRPKKRKTARSQSPRKPRSKSLRKPRESSSRRLARTLTSVRKARAKPPAKRRSPPRKRYRHYLGKRELRRDRVWGRAYEQAILRQALAVQRGEPLSVPPSELEKALARDTHPSLLEAAFTFRRRSDRAKRARFESRLREVVTYARWKLFEGVDGTSVEGWKLIRRHMRDRTDEYLEFIELLEVAAIPYDEGIDELFSPSADE